MIRFVFMLSLVCISHFAFAYVPPYWMILSRTADNHGKGAYVVEQDVTFNHGEEPLTIRERWIVMDENSMRLEASGRKSLQNRFSYTAVYKSGRLYFVDENGVRQSEKFREDFFEPFFHFRNSKTMKNTLVQMNIAPSVSLKSGTFKYSPTNPQREPEPYVRLARVGGAIAYAVGTPTPASSSELYPGIWIEQDQFHVRRFRTSAGVQIDAGDYNSYSGGLWLPKERQVSWGSSAAKITLANVSTARVTANLKTSMEPSSLNFGKEPGVARKLPEDEVIRTFYTRMR